MNKTIFYLYKIVLMKNTIFLPLKIREVEDFMTDNKIDYSKFSTLYKAWRIAFWLE